MLKKILLFLSCVYISLNMASVVADDSLKTEKQKLSYALGIYFSQSIAQQKDELDKDAFIQAIDDIFTNSKPKLTQEEIQTVLSDYQQKLASKMDAVASENKLKGEKFLNENKKKEGVVVLDSGLQYKVVKEGEGEKPGKDSFVKVHYHGTLIGGEVFDSSYERGTPVTLSLNQVIKGWQEAVPLMNVGSKWQIYVPSEMAYGSRGAGGGAIGPNETLIFDIELLAVNSQE